MMKKTIILIQELIDSHSQDGNPKRTLSYKGLNIIDDDYSIIITEIKNQTLDHMSYYENKKWKIKIPFFIPEEDRPRNNNQYISELWKIDKNEALNRLKSWKKIETNCGNEYSNNFWIKPGIAIENQFFISILDI